MWKIGTVGIFALAGIQAQGFQDLRLPQSRHIVGVVVDSKGTPVAGARIDHSDARSEEHKTDSAGKFQLDTRAPTLVIRKAGFRSELVRTRAETEVRITLKEFDRNRAFTTCSNALKYEGIDGWGSSFQFPRTSEMKASPQARDIDYGARSYYVETKEGAKGIRHGSGPMWSFGTQSDQDVWGSDEYEEIVYDFHGRTIIDARGKLRSGKRWRYLGKFGESASYSDMDKATANILGRFLDSACLKATSRP